MKFRISLLQLPLWFFRGVFIWAGFSWLGACMLFYALLAQSKGLASEWAGTLALAFLISGLGLLWLGFKKVRGWHMNRAIPEDQDGAGAAALMGLIVAYIIILIESQLLGPASHDGTASIILIRASMLTPFLLLWPAAGLLAFRFTSSHSYEMSKGTYWFVFLLANAGVSTLVSEVIVKSVSSEDLLVLGYLLAIIVSLFSAAYLVWRYVQYRKDKGAAETTDDETEQFMLIFELALFIGVVVFFAFLLNKFFGWPMAITLPAGMLAVSLLVILSDDEKEPIQHAAVIATSLVVSIILAIIAVRLPPSAMALIFIVIGSVTAALLLKFSKLKREAEWPVFSSAMTMIATALLLITLPTNGSIAHRLSSWTVFMSEPGAGIVRKAYLATYHTVPGRALINLTEGIHTERVSAKLTAMDYLQNPQRLYIRMETTNTGEMAVVSYEIEFPSGPLFYGILDELERCKHAIEKVWQKKTNLLPGDSQKQYAVIVGNKTCLGRDLEKIAEAIRYQVNSYGLKLETHSVKTGEFDRVALFKKESRKWLDL